LDESVYGEGGFGVVCEEGYDLGFVLELFPLPAPISAKLEHHHGICEQTLTRAYHAAPASVTAKSFSIRQIS
jgi:hypothetical protein